MRLLDLARYTGLMILFTTLSIIYFLLFGHRHDFQSDMLLAAMATILWAIRDGQKVDTGA